MWVFNLSLPAVGCNHPSDSFSCQQKLDELQRHVTEMRISCDEAERQLAIAAEASGTLLERAGSLREERCVGVSTVSIIQSTYTITTQAGSREEKVHCDGFPC